MRNQKSSKGFQRPHSAHSKPRSPNLGLRMAVGIHAAKEALLVRPKSVVRVILRSKYESSGDLQELAKIAKRHQIEIKEMSPEQLNRLSGQHQGVCVEISGRPTIDLSELEQAGRSVVLVLDGVEDPHNLGAILRTSWLMGVKAVVVPSDRAVGLVPTVHKVACGGVEHVPVLEVPNLSNLLASLKDKGYWIFGLAAGGRQTMETIRLPEKVVWVLGAEDKGLRVTTSKACDELVSIPQLNDAASYNVSVATGIALYETLKQASIEKL